VSGTRRPLVATASLFPLIANLILVTACHSSPEKQQEKLRQELSSWEATDRLARELSDRGAVPRVYVRQIAEAVEQGKQKVRQQAAKSSQ
jgi:hypothetical protein